MNEDKHDPPWVEALLEERTVELRVREALFRRLSENVPAVFYQFQMSPDGAFSFPYISKAVNQLTGVPAEDVLEDASSLLGMIHPDDQAAFHEEVLESARKMEKYAAEFRFLRDGKAFWVEAQSIPESLPGGTVLWDGFFSDISERKRAEEELLAANQRLRATEQQLRRLEKRSRALIDHSPVCHKIIDLDFNLQYMSANGFRMLKLEETDERYGEPYPFDFFPGPARETLKDGLANVRASGKVVTFETRVCDVEGTPVWLHHSIIPVFDEDGDIGFITVVSADVTDRKRAEDLQKALLEILEASLTSESIQALAERIHQTVGRLMDARNFFLASYDKKTDTYTFPYFVDERDSGRVDLSKPLKLGRGFTEYVRRSKKPLLINKARVQDLVDRGEVEIIGSRSESWLGVPLFDGDEVMGVVVVQSYSDPDAYSEEDLSILTFVSGHISLVLKKVQAEEALRESEERFRVAQELSPDGFTILRPIRDPDGRVVDFTWVFQNATVARMNGTDQEGVVGKRLLDLFPGQRESPFMSAYQEAAETGRSIVFEAEYGRESLPAPTWFRVAVVRTGTDIAVLSQDITDRRIAEKELAESRDRLRMLTARLDQIREEERTALARELHDDVGQNLTALRMDLSRIEREVPKEMKHLTTSLDSMIALTQDSVDRLNRLSTELRSPILDMLGLEDAVESEVWDYQERWNTEIELEMDLGGIEASPDRDLTVYRILRESLANVRRHAQATRIEVKLEVNDGCLELRVLDDGVGITDAQRRAPDSFGLMGMSERAERVGGKLEIKGLDEGGTLVRAVIPCRVTSQGDNSSS